MSRDLNVDQIKKLWLLDLVLKNGSLKLAALAAKVSPSAVSQSLTSLEQAFGKPLLIREKGSVFPTTEGLEVLKIVRPAFAAFERLKDFNNLTAPELAWINFGTYESIAIDLLPGLMQGLKKKLPKLKLGVRISRTDKLITMIRKGELCSALITETENLEKFYVKEVATDRLGLYVSRQHDIAKLGWEAIESVGFGTLTPGRDGHPRYFSNFLRNHQLKNPAVLSESFEALRSTAASGTLVCVLPARVANRYDDLLEITKLNSKVKNEKHQGIHKIILVSKNNCDPIEVDFMAQVAEQILQ